MSDLAAGKYISAFTAVLSNGRTVHGRTTFTIAKVAPTCTVIGYHVTYDSSPHTATGSCSGVGGTALPASWLNLAGTTHTDAAAAPATAYRDSWTFTDPNGNYSTRNRTVTDTIDPADNSITFTSAPGSATVGGATYTPAATSTAGGTVTFTIDSTSSTICSIAADNSVSFLAAGTCTIDADQAASLDYSAAPRAQQGFLVTTPTPTIEFVSTAPADAVVGGDTYAPQATSTPAGTVTLTIDGDSAGICSIDSSNIVSFVGAGTCTVVASEPGTGAIPATQSFTVGQGTPTITFGTDAPSTATVAGATYLATATSDSDQSVSVTVDVSSAAVCAISPLTGYVNYIGPGTCTIDATVAPDSDWNGNSASQTISVSWPTLQTAVNQVDDPQTVVYPPLALTQCAAQTITLGGCFINPLDGSSVNIFDATGTVAPSTDPGFDPNLDVVAYHWQLWKPPGLRSLPYSSNGMTGYHAGVLTILDSSLPDLVGSIADNDIFWREELTVTINGHAIDGFFKFAYQSSLLALSLSTTCQLPGQAQTAACQLQAPHGLPATEPT